MANEELPEAIGIEFDDFVCEGAIRELRRQDVIALYRGLAEADSSQLRGIAAQGAYNVVRIDPTEGLRLLNELRTDADPQVALQAEETLHDLPELLAGSS
ncbi:MAG TPA: hypothetical protein VKT78_20505 [Fimbriimonadaceae bacterium]|nr:hypothetical protein [Fimbriimonadaceae bacterium]